VATEQQIWDALTKAGYSANQAAGIMGNMQNESSFNQEANAIDTNGKASIGLIQWNEATYPNAGSLVTGNASKDLADQIAALKTNTNGVASGLEGSTAAQVAGNWAQYVEVCAGCQPGGSQYNQRVANATQILSQAQSGNWPAGGPGVSGGSPGDSGGSGGSGGSSCSGVSLTSPGSWFSPSAWACTTGITNELTNIETGLKDAGERLGLYVLGGIMVLMGIWILFKDSQGSKQSPAADDSSGKEKDAAKPVAASASEEVAEGAVVA
jgi:hypothetical protein